MPAVAEALLNANRGQFIARAPIELKASEQEKLVPEGYRFYGQDASDFAAAGEVAMAEALDRACQPGGDR